MAQGTIGFTAPHGIPIPVGDTVGACAIAHWLGNDIQYSQASIDRWLKLFRGVSEGGESQGYLGTGNAFSVFATKELILLESEHVESHKACMTLNQLSEALDRYRSFLSSDYKAPDAHPVPFQVEYLAEGIEAPKCYLDSGGVLV